MKGRHTSTALERETGGSQRLAHKDSPGGGSRDSRTALEREIDSCLRRARQDGSGEKNRGRHTRAANGKKKVSKVGGTASSGQRHIITMPLSTVHMSSAFY